MIGNWELNGLDEADLNYLLSVANAEAACRLTQDMIDGIYNSTFSHAKVLASLLHHSTELFLKYAIRRRRPLELRHHSIRELYSEYRKLFPEPEFDFTPPFVAQFIAMSSDCIGVCLTEGKNNKNQTDQMLRYHTDRLGNPWRETSGFIPDQFLVETKVFLDRIKELRDMIEKRANNNQR